MLILLFVLVLFLLASPANSYTLYGYCSNTKGVIGIVASHHTVGKVIAGSPAEGSGLKRGDKILNYKDLDGEALTFCHLIVKRGNDKLEFDVLRLPEASVFGHKAGKSQIEER